jgi:hypothetical protein
MSSRSSPRQNAGPPPWIKWFPGDWLGDEKLQLCSLAAQGLWKNCICLMHRATPYGHLLVNGRPPTAATLAAITRSKPTVIKHLLEELVSHGVASQTPEGVLYSRRMIRDRERSERNAANGANGGNPRLTTSDNPQPSIRLTESDNQVAYPNGLTESDKPDASSRITESDKPRLRDRAIAQEAEAETEADQDLPSGKDQPEGAHTPHAPPQPVGQPEDLTLDLRPPSAHKGQASASAAAQAERTRYMRAYADRYAQHRHQDYGRPEQREWKHAKDMLAQYGYARLWTMSEKFIIEPSTEYPFDGARTITELYAHRRRIEGRLIELKILTPSAASREVTDVA